MVQDLEPHHPGDIRDIPPGSDEFLIIRCPLSN
jgi:hypothetical protein